jgi:uncharacterized protein YjbI with pentapeptide repeats
MSITESNSQPFVSLQALEHASDALIADLPEDELSASDSDCEAIAERIELFIDRAIMTGKVLDAPDDRKAAQALVDFWVAKRFAVSRANHTKQRPSTRTNTLLRPFDRAAMTAAIAEGDKVLASLRRRDDGQSKGFLRRILSRVAPSVGDDGASYHDIARRMLLRTIPISSGDRTCEPMAVKRSDLLLLGDPVRSKAVLDALVASGVLREEPTESGALISLRYETLPEDWQALRSLIAERVSFRDTAVSWQQRGSAKHALASAGQANKAQADYADVNELERVFIAASSSHGRRKLIVLSIVFAVALPFLGIVSKIIYDRWEAAKREAATARAILTVLSTDDKQLKEESIRKLAQFGEPLNFQSLPLEHLDLKNIYGGAKSPAIVELFRSGIVSVNLAGATLPYASFSQCKIYEVQFPGAELSSARFDEAVIAKTDFSNAVLYRAIFDHAQFNERNDFSNADLRSASFRDVEINGDLIFTDSAWWLAFGWTLPQIERFAAQYRDVDIKKTKIFNDEIIRGTREIDKATSREDHVRALNAMAWTYAIYGADLELAEEYAQKTSEEFARIKTMKGKSDTWIAKNDANFTDTKAYILLQEDKPAKAVELYEQPGIVEPNSQGDLIFRYAVALHALAMTKTGDEMERLDQEAQLRLKQSLKNRNYIPSHELYLLGRYITDEFKAKLVANLSNDAN